MSNYGWTKKQLDFLKEEGKNHTSRELAKIFNKKDWSIRWKAKELGIKFKKLRWKEEERDFLKENSENFTFKDLCEKLQKAPGSVFYMLNKNDLKCKRLREPKKWTKKEISELKKCGGKKTIPELMKIFGRSYGSIHGKLSMLNIKIKEIEPKGHINSRGYKVVSNGEGSMVFEHRNTIEKSIGRKLSKLESVHHIDLNKVNNKTENLLLCKNEKEHVDVHRNLKKLIKNLIEKKIIIFDREKNIYVARLL